MLSREQMVALMYSMHHALCNKQLTPIVKKNQIFKQEKKNLYLSVQGREGQMSRVVTQGRAAFELSGESC